jgi:hypothetical protein
MGTTIALGSVVRKRAAMYRDGPSMFSSKVFANAKGRCGTTAIHDLSPSNFLFVCVFAINEYFQRSGGLEPHSRGLHCGGPS